MTILVDPLLIPCDTARVMDAAFNPPVVSPIMGNMAEEWMTVLEAMQLLGVGRSRIYELKNDGTFRWERSGRILKLDAVTVREYAARDKKPGWPRGRLRIVKPGD